MIFEPHTKVKPSALNLWVIHADKIPPHIGISDLFGFYSLKASGKDEGIPLDDLIKVLNKKNIATLIFEIDNQAALSNEVFATYSKTIPGEVSCLAPVKEVLGLPNATKLHDLIEQLENQKRIKAVFGLCLEKNFQGISDYGVDAIEARLKLLAAQ